MDRRSHKLQIRNEKGEFRIHTAAPILKEPRGGKDNIQPFEFACGTWDTNRVLWQPWIGHSALQ
jgi:hypothetical protein